MLLVVSYPILVKYGLSESRMVSWVFSVIVNAAVVQTISIPILNE
jgi:hypothetical protein